MNHIQQFDVGVRSLVREAVGALQACFTDRLRRRRPPTWFHSGIGTFVALLITGRRRA